MDDKITGALRALNPALCFALGIAGPVAVFLLATLFFAPGFGEAYR